MVIDFHVHMIQYQMYQRWCDEFMAAFHPDYDEIKAKYGDPDAFIELQKSNGVDKSVVLAELSPISTGMCTNEQVSQFCAGRPELIPFCCLNPFLSGRLDLELERLVKEQGFKGLKLYPTYNYFFPNDSLMYPLYAKAQELGIPVMLHTGSSVFQGSRLKYGEPICLDDVAVDFPDLKILLVHGGRGFWYDQAFFLAKLHRNVYLEISGLPPSRLLTYFPELERLAGKIIFGSDWPGLSSVAENIKTIRELPLKSSSIAKILGGNAARLLGLG